MLDGRALTLLQRQVAALTVWSLLCVGAMAHYASGLVHMRAEALTDAQSLLERRDAGEQRAQRRWRGDRIDYLHTVGSRLLADTSIPTDAKAIPGRNLERLLEVEYEALRQAHTRISPASDDKLEAATYVLSRRGVLPVNATPTGRLDQRALDQAFADQADLDRLLAVARDRAAGQSPRDYRAEEAARIKALARQRGGND